MAHQFLGQLPDLLREAVTGMRKCVAESEFSCYVRNLTPSALALRVPFGKAERGPKMSPKSYAGLRDRIRAEVAAPIAELDAHIATAMPEPSNAHEETQRLQTTTDVEPRR